ncbi:MAG: acyl carrier protein [Patescibacteria group bacterium]|nr:acyl carrier protein [Patescibacteria group bacterium]
MADQQKIIEAIAESLTLPVADIDMDSSLQDDLGLNPVEVADLVESLSQKFHILFDHHELGQVKTVSDLVELIEDKLLE